MIWRAISAITLMLAFFSLLVGCGYALGYADAYTYAARDIPVCRAQSFPVAFKGTLP